MLFSKDKKTLYEIITYNKFENITIPDSVTTIDKHAFINLNGTNHNFVLDISKNNNSFTFENGALFNKDKTILYKFLNKAETHYTIPSSVKIIDDYAFETCELLESIVIPDGVKSIGNYAFSNCKNLKSELYIPDSVETIGDYAFFNCYYLKNIFVSNSVIIGKEVDSIIGEGRNNYAYKKKIRRYRY
jgi:hypothetical protein